MFLRDLTTDQKRAFLVLADKLILSDGGLVPMEATYLATLRAEMDIGDEAVPSMELSQATEAFDSRKAKVSAILELMALGRADGDFNKEETNVLRDIKGAFGLSGVDFELMMNWVLRQMALVREAADLMEREV